MLESFYSAAENLAQRFEVLQAPTRLITLAEWRALPAHADVIPTWIKDALAAFPLADGVLEYRDSRSNMLRVFGFMTPELMKRYVQPDTDYEAIVQHGFLPVAHADNGNVWLIDGEGEESNLYYFDNSIWDGINRPSRTNGLVFASDRLAFAVISMGISEATYYSVDRPKRIIWYSA